MPSFRSKASIRHTAGTSPNSPGEAILADKQERIGEVLQRRSRSPRQSVEGSGGHGGRLGLASELTARGASTTETMLAGGWTTHRMVAHYNAGVAAEQGRSPSTCEAATGGSEVQGSIEA